MSNFRLIVIVFSLLINYSFSQTTDLSVVVAAQSLSGNDISQAHIYEEFQYVITIINSGNSVNNASFTQSINPNVEVLSYNSQNQQGGASEAGSFTLTPGNTLLGTVASMPNNSSVEIRVVVKAPLNIGGIATEANVFVPSDVTDTAPSNNQSIISIDITDVDIDFTVTYAQTNPTEGTGISAWNDIVTYEFTITNNSIIDYPLSGFKGRVNLASNINFGSAVVEFASIQCIGSSGGTDCPNATISSLPPVVVASSQEMFDFNIPHLFTSGGSLTFEISYRYLEPSCSFEIGNLAVNSYIELSLNHDNVSSNLSNQVNTNLLIGELCDLTDPCISTVQINPDASLPVAWEEEVTFETTVCNNGPLEAPMRFFLQNLSPSIAWEIISVNCIDATNGINCSDVILTIDSSGIFWSSNSYLMPVDATLTIETVVKFLEPECATNTNANQAHVRSGTNLLSSTIFDSNLLNSAESDYVILPPSDLCPSSDIAVEKTQIAPVLPEGSSSSNTTSWGMVTYEITVSNLSETVDTAIILNDYISTPNQAIGTLISVDCVATTGSASCFDISTTNIGVPLDGIPEAGESDIFWQIVAEDNWALPALSSVTFEVVVNWEPECSLSGIPANNSVEIFHANDNIDVNTTNDQASVTTFFAPCVDLVVQTFPEFTSINTNQNFNWIVDITNSETSSSATNILFENLLDDAFTLNGTPTCTITNGTATCISTFDTSGNPISGIIPSMEPGSTIRISIPVTAPSYGGAFTNLAEATPDAADNEEITPETNISISNVQVIAPTLEKEFNPAIIVVGYESILTFTINNIENNTAQNDIAFTDNLPAGIVLSGTPYWVNDNGCTADFNGNIGDDFVGISNLSIPEGVSSCTFAVAVTSDLIGSYLNNNDNFSDQVNIDTSQTSATLDVIEDTSNVDIEIIKEVSPEEVALGDQVEFTITATNIGTTNATEIEVSELLPIGYVLVSFTVTSGVYDETTGLWHIEELDAETSVSLTIIAQVVSSTDLLNTATLINTNEIDRDDTNNSSSASVTINNCLTISEGISPNDDGYNDTLTIPCIEEYDTNVLKIYNRYGTLIYEMANYNNSWNGTPNKGLLKTNNKVPVGTYFYVLEVDASIEPKVGWIYLNY
jgi:gliding motility-associated-like protein/uncharacterized repeat protein (TIGR01451 family)